MQYTGTLCVCGTSLDPVITQACSLLTSAVIISVTYGSTFYFHIIDVLVAKPFNNSHMVYFCVKFMYYVLIYSFRSAIIYNK
jgi:hypothetical protein